MKIVQATDDAIALYRKINSTCVPCPDASIKDLFESQVARHPGDTAVVCDHEQLTYARLNKLANGLAQRLIDAGVRPGETIGVNVSRSIPLVVALIAAVKCGAVYAPVDLSWPDEMLTSVAADSQFKCLLTDGSGAEADHHIRGCDAIWVGEHTGRETDENPELSISGEALAYINFTSGSTGRPKGVQIRHRSVARLVTNARYAELNSSSSVLHVSPATFDAATFEIWGPLLNGGTCVIYPGRHITFAKLAQVTDDARVTCIFLTTALFNAVVDDAPAALNGVRTILFGGERCSVRHVENALRRYGTERLVHVYGPTECTTFATYHRVNDIRSDLSTIPIGRPIQNTKIYVVHDGTLCQPGEVGEIAVAGPGLAVGYVGDTSQACRFTWMSVSDSEERVYMTGDLGYVTSDGDLVFEGRSDDQVKVNGFRIELPAVLHAINNCGLVKQSYVTVSNGVAGERALLAFVVPESDSCDAASVRGYLRTRLPSYMVPATVCICDSLPLLASGKVDRNSLLSRNGGL